MKKISKMSLGELAAYICSYLEENGIGCVLTGGACISIYTDNKYQSNDLDFIEIESLGNIKLKELLLNIGFKKENRYFVHPETKFYVEFLSGPLALGSEPIKEINSLQYSTGILRLLTVTDIIKDRLAAYFYWDDLQVLEQIKKLIEKNKYNKKEILRWVKAEGQEAKYKELKKNHRLII